MESRDNSKKPLSLIVKIISPEGIRYDSLENLNVLIKSIVAKGVIRSKGEFSNLNDETAFDFEILPDHSPFVAKVASNSQIKITGDNIKSEYFTKNGGIVRVTENDTNTIAVFTLEDVECPNEKNK